MSSRKKKRRRPAPIASARNGDPTRRPGASGTGDSRTSRRAPVRPSNTGTGKDARGSPSTSTGGRSRASSPARSRQRLLTGPRIAPSLARGLAVVGSSPEILISIFLAAFVLWLIYSSFGSIRIVSPAVLAQMLSIPPMQTLLDLQVLFTGVRIFAPTTSLALGLALLLLRAALLGFWVALIHAKLQPRDGLDHPGWRADVLAAARRSARCLVVVAGIQVVFAVGYYGLFSIAGALLQVLGILIVLVALMYFLGLATIAAVTEEVGFVAAIQLGTRGARSAGRQYLFICAVYVLATLYLLFLLPGSRFAEATPSIRIWEYVLIVSVLHVSVLAMLVYRWLAARGEVVAAWGEERASRPASGGALAGLFRPLGASRRSASPGDPPPVEDEPEVSEGRD
jgi:hypothetical protein